MNTSKRKSCFKGYPLGGCTACVCAITNDSIFTANAGDSRAVLYRGS